jgi:small subunit ribosomal protein S8
MVNDTISDMLTRIRNSSLVKKRNTAIEYTKLNLKIAEILEKEGFIQNFEIQKKDFLKKKSKKIENFKNTLVTIKELKINLKYYKKFRTKYYKLNHIKSEKALTTFKNLVKLLRGKQGRQTTSCITNLRRISKPGLRIYANHKELPKILGGIGIVILSTSQGILTDRQARFRGIGGEILCSIW